MRTFPFLVTALSFAIRIGSFIMPTSFRQIPLAYGNKQPLIKRYIIQQVNTFVGVPALDAAALENRGCLSISLAAFQPTFACPVSDKANHRVGQFFGLATQLPGTTSEEFFEANFDAQDAFASYEHFLVQGCSISATVEPVPDDIELGGKARSTIAAEDIRAPECRAILTIGKEKLIHGNTPAAIFDIDGATDGVRTTSRIKGTTTRLTRVQRSGGKTTARLSGYYTPKGLYHIRDLQDNLEQFEGQTSGNYQIDPETHANPVPNKAFFTITVVPNYPLPDGVAGASGAYRGVPVPHRFTVKLVWDTVVYSRDVRFLIPAQPSAGGGSSWFSRAMDTMIEMAGGGGAAEADGAGSKRSADDAFGPSTNALGKLAYMKITQEMFDAALQAMIDAI